MLQYRVFEENGSWGVEYLNPNGALFDVWRRLYTMSSSRSRALHLARWQARMHNGVIVEDRPES